MPYKCPDCDFSTVYKDKYNTHWKIHLRAKGITEEEAKTTLYYYCDKCGKQFTNQYSVNVHIKTVHEGVYTPATCPICGMTFKTKLQMNRHHILNHSTNQKYQCKYCEKRCSNTADLREHLRKHEEPTFKCSYCDKMLKRKSALKEHERIHTGERPYR
jgi:KRAB domain-containing zinc finger protein